MTTPKRLSVLEENLEMYQELNRALSLKLTEQKSELRLAHSHLEVTRNELLHEKLKNGQFKSYIAMFAFSFKQYNNAVIRSLKQCYEETGLEMRIPDPISDEYFRSDIDEEMDSINYPEENNMSLKSRHRNGSDMYNNDHDNSRLLNTIIEDDQSNNNNKGSPRRKSTRLSQNTEKMPFKRLSIRMYDNRDNIEKTVISDDDSVVPVKPSELKKARVDVVKCKTSNKDIAKYKGIKTAGVDEDNRNSDNDDDYSPTVDESDQSDSEIRSLADSEETNWETFPKRRSSRRAATPVESYREKSRQTKLRRGKN